MASVYTINGQPATKEQYDAFIAANPTLASAADLASTAKITDPPILGEAGIPPMSTFLGGPLKSSTSPQANFNRNTNGPLPSNFQLNNAGSIGPTRDLKVPLGAQPNAVVRVTEATITTLSGQSSSTNPDLRVRLRVPSDYITSLTSGSSLSELSALGGIIFPYTPTISFENKADYSSQTPTHSNYAINFYKNSSVSDISISGKFTVQNERDALVYLSSILLLKALTKMRFGGPAAPSAGAGRGAVNYSDPDSGAPPPVCRLDAYGDFMLKNVPVVITSFRTEWPDTVDFYSLNGNLDSRFGQTSVPTVSTIAITCKPMYSRAEMQSMSVTKYLNDSFYRRQGFL